MDDTDIESLNFTFTGDADTFRLDVRILLKDGERGLMVLEVRDGFALGTKTNDVDDEYHALPDAEIEILPRNEIRDGIDHFREMMAPGIQPPTSPERIERFLFMVGVCDLALWRLDQMGNE